MDALPPLSEYLPILMLLGVALIFGLITVTLSSLIGPRNPTAEKLSPYECGIPPVGSSRDRFSIRFYLIAMLFILFDIEVVFLFPWAVVLRSLKLTGLITMGIFILVLLIGFLYVWKKGALEWE